VEDSHCAIKRDLPQIRRESDDTNIIFWRGGLECLGVTIKHYLYKIIRYLDMCTELEMLEVKVPNHFFGTESFSAYKDGRCYRERGTIIKKFHY
jgi:hypothetical protein